MSRALLRSLPDLDFHDGLARLREHLRQVERLRDVPQRHVHRVIGEIAPEAAASGQDAKALSAAAQQGAARYEAVTEARLLNPEPHNWLMNHRTYDGQRFSPLTQINKQNVKKLVPVWAYSITDNRGAEGFPLVKDGVIYTTAHNATVAVDALTGKSRQRDLVTSRQVAMYVFRELTDLSYPAIARLFGGRDHTTVIHAVDKIQRLMGERKQVYDQVTDLLQRLKKG